MKTVESPATPSAPVAPAETPLNLKTDIVEVENVEPQRGGVVDAYAVWKLIDKFHKIRAYFKLTTPEEIDNTILFNKIVTENGLRNENSLVDFEYPKYLSNKYSDLSDEAVAEIKAGMEYIIHYIRGGAKRAQVPLITTAINTSRFMLGNKLDKNVYGDITNDIGDVSQEALAALKGKPITNEEWREVVKFFRELNRNGFYHGDLKHNLFFRRDDSGKLIISIVDFEDSDSYGSDVSYLREMAADLELIGAKEKSSPIKTNGNETNNHSPLNLPSWVLPTAIGVGLLAVALTNPITSPLALAAMGTGLLATTFPIIDIDNINNNSLNLKTDIVKVNPISNLVMELRDLRDNVVAYYKRTEEDEVDRTELFDEIISENNLQNKYSLIELEYPRILSTDLSELPTEIANQIKSQVSDHKFLTEDMILTAVNTEGSYEYNSNSNKSARQTLQETLKGKPITNEEWEQVVNLVKDFNDAGFEHTDLENNIFFRRNENGKLIVTIIDFECFGKGYGDHSDMSALDFVRVKLESIGAKEVSSNVREDNVSNPFNVVNPFFSDFTSFLLPIIGLALFTAALINSITSPFAMAAMGTGLLASTFPIGGVDNPLANRNGDDDGDIPAKVLFTQEYKDKDIYFIWKDMQRVIAALPSGFEGENKIYRGMTLGKYEDLKELFTVGLLGSRTINGNGEVYFSNNIDTGIGYSTQYAFGHLPVLVKKHQDNMMRSFISYDDVAAEDIEEILVWAELNGKLGWWRAVLDNNGEVVLQPTDNMQLVNTDTEQNINFQAVQRAVNVKADNNSDVEAYAVWALLDENGNPIYYLKYTNND